MKTKYIIGIILLIIVGLVLIKSQQKNPERQSGTTLYPEKTISHGHGLAVDVQDPAKLYIATHYGLMVLMNEKDLFRIGNSKDDYMGFSPHPTEANVFFSSGHPSFGGNIGFQTSENGGFTWKKIANGVNGPVDFHAMAVSPVNSDLIYGWYQGNLQRSTDQGKTWEIVNRDILAVSLAADSQDENTVYTATPKGQGVLVSRDTGVSWASLSKELEGGAVSVITVHPENPNILLVFSEKLGGLGKSVDAGKTWTKTDETFNGETILHVAFDKSNPNVVYALTHENTLYKSTDTGGTWQKIR